MIIVISTCVNTESASSLSSFIPISLLTCTRPLIWQVRRSGTCTHRHTCTVHIPAYKTAHTAGTPVRDVHTQTHMYIQYTSPHTRPHIWQVRRSGTCTYRHTCTVHIPAYKTAHTAGTPVRDVHTQTHMYIQYTSPPTRPHIWHVRRSGTCTHRHTCTVHIPAYKTAHTAGTPVRDVHTQTHMYIQYTSPPTIPHIWQVRRSGTCTHRHTCTVHIPAYKTAHMAGTPVRDVHTQTDKYYTHVDISTFAFRIML